MTVAQQALCPWNFPVRKNAGMGCRFFLRIFPQPRDQTRVLIFRIGAGDSLPPRHWEALRNAGKVMFGLELKMTKSSLDKVRIMWKNKVHLVMIQGL